MNKSEVVLCNSALGGVFGKIRLALGFVDEFYTDINSRFEIYSRQSSPVDLRNNKSRMSARI